MTNDTTSMEMKIMLEVANLVQVGKSIIDCLGSETLFCPQKAQKLRDPVLSICRLLLAVNIDDDWETTRKWVGEVSKALYEASDLVDTAVADGAALAASSSLVSKVRCRSLFGLSRSSSNSLFGVRMDPIINRLCQTLSQLKQEAIDTGLEEGLPLPVVTPPADDVYVGIIYGTENYKRSILGSLRNTGNLNQSVSVVSIVGMAGVGKTRLADLVYNDIIIDYYFDLKLWVRVSKEFETEKILKSIISSIQPTSSGISDLVLEELIDLLKIRISGKLFLLVLDDVWNEDPEKWASLWTPLQAGARGSKILVTTRSPTVADICDSYCYKLRGLSKKYSWRLFKEIAFRSSGRPKKIFSSARKIVKRCGGIPLAIAVLASFLREISEAEWEDACSHIFMPSDSFDSSSSYLMPILKQSFKSLPPPVKLCFAYCSLFPEDHVFSVTDLVHQWIAQGYIRPENNQDDLEAIARQYFLILSNRFFFINKAWVDKCENIVTCQMHDLVRDMAITVSKEWAHMKHLSLFQRSGTTTWLRENWLKDERKLQSLLCGIAPEDEDDAAARINIDDIVEMSSFKSLRVLDLHAFGLQVLPDSIGNLIHVRYLDLSHNKSLLKLPNTISNLHHLQTLKLGFCYELRELPATFGKLVCLRHLEIDGCDKLTCMPPGFENLSSLQILPRYVVGRSRIQSISGFAALGNLNHLRGRLIIELSENWTTDVEEAVKSNLSNKTKLTELGIRWGPTRSTRETDRVQYKKLVDGLQPPSDLTLLQIERYRGQDFPRWASGNALLTELPKLITVIIDGGGECETLPPFSCLPFLKCLSLRFMDNVQYFENSDNQSSTSWSPYFPSLEDLTIHSFYSLKGWWKEEISASFSCLRKLKMWSCPKLTSMPLFPEVEVLDMQNINQKLLESHSSWVTRSELQTSSLPSSSQPDISNIEKREHSQSLIYLTTVQIKSCPRLKTLTLVKSSKKLKKLVLDRLDNLSSLTEVLKQLTLLKELEIASCKDLDLSGECQDSWIGCEKCDVPWNSLLKLECLTLRELPKLVTLPVGLRFVKNLRILCISACSSLSKLPEFVSNLTSLEHLRLEGCPALKMLPEGLKDISSLVKIDILECPQLTERCTEGGKDWHKIKHARVLCHKSWRYAMMSETDLS